MKCTKCNKNYCLPSKTICIICNNQQSKHIKKFKINNWVNSKKKYILGH